MSENPRIDELRRRVEKDPTSIAFAQLAEEHRRIGEYEEAVKVCRDGLARHPGYLSAQVTLGRALMELEQFDEAKAELEAVLNLAPDNLAAIRALADIHQRRGDVGETINLDAVGGLGPGLSAEASAKAEGSSPHEEPVAVALDVPPLELPELIDFSLDSTMPTFDQASDGTAPSEVSAAHSTELPALTADDLPSLEALDALTLDLPPLPDFSGWSLDTELRLDTENLLGRDQGSGIWDQKPSEQSSNVLDPRSPIPDPYNDPALEELEGWLSAIVADRSQPR